MQEGALRIVYKDYKGIYEELLGQAKFQTYIKVD